jgi:hypothetical protein
MSWVYVKNLGVNAFPLVAALFWLYGFQPDEEMQVSGLGDDGQLNLRGHAEVPGGVNAITLRDRYPRRGAPLPYLYRPASASSLAGDL